MGDVDPSESLFKARLSAGGCLEAPESQQHADVCRRTDVFVVGRELGPEGLAMDGSAVRDSRVKRIMNTKSASYSASHSVTVAQAI